MSFSELLSRLDRNKPIALVVDLDDTLYDTAPIDHALALNAAKLLDEVKGLGLFESFAKVRHILNDTNYVRETFWLQYGISYPRTLESVYHPKNLPEFDVPPKQSLKAALENLPAERFILTNSPSYYSDMIIGKMGLRDTFHAVIATDKNCHYKKNTRNAYLHCERLTGISPLTHNIIFVDNQLDNLAVAHDLGWHGVYTGEFTNEYPDILPNYVRCYTDNLVEFTHALRGAIINDQHFKRPDRQIPRSARPGSRI